MLFLRQENPQLIQANINFWPSFVDVVTTILMLFVFINMTLLTVVGDPDAEKVRIAREELRYTLEERLRREPDGNAVTFASTPNLLQIRFSDKVLFDLGKYTLKDPGKRLLSSCAEILTSKSAPEFDQIQVEGHTDIIPLNSSQYPRDNWELSSARALAVLKYLLYENISAQKLSANGYAEFRPLKHVSTGSDIELNRRVELRIVFFSPNETIGN